MKRAVRWMRLVFTVAVWLGAYATGCAGGCAGPLPDVGPLVTATAVCREAVTAAGREVVAAVRETQGGTEPARRLVRAWALRELATNAMVEYAAALRAASDRATGGEARAKALTDRLSHLATAAGFVVPSVGALPIASATAAMVWGQIDRARASDDLVGTVREAQGAVAIITEKLAEDHDDLSLIIDLACESMAAEIRSETGVATLAAFRREAQDAAKVLIERGEAAMTDADRARLVELASLVAATDPAWTEVSRRLAAVEQKRERCEEIVARMGEAVRAWATAHAGVVRAIETGGGVNVDELVLSAGRLREAVRRAGAEEGR